MKRKPIDWKQASVAATFYEPVYQRLRLWHEGQMVHLLCFVSETSDPVQRLLSECGAAPSRTLRAHCFAEVWELPQQTLMAGAYGSLPAKLDQAISDALGCRWEGIVFSVWAGSLDRHRRVRLSPPAFSKPAIAGNGWAIPMSGRADSYPASVSTEELRLM